MNEESKQKDKSKSSSGLFSKPVVFVLGAATTYVLGATAPALRKVTDPLVTSTLKGGIRLTRSVRGTASRVGANLADSYAKAQFELEQEERESRSGKNGPRVVKMDDHKDKDKGDDKE